MTNAGSKTTDSLIRMSTSKRAGRAPSGPKSLLHFDFDITASVARIIIMSGTEMKSTPMSGQRDCSDREERENNYPLCWVAFINRPISDNNSGHAMGFVSTALAPAPR